MPDPAKPLTSQDPLTLLAMCLFGEARGESPQAQRAVAQVVLNRAKHPHAVFGSRRGADLAENLRRVILRPRQFSSFNSNDPNYAKLLRPLEHEKPAVWEQCLRCAQEALASQDQEDTLTGNSDHYFDDSIQPPAWANPAKQTVKIGRLNFYRLYLPPPKGSASAGQGSGAGDRAGTLALAAAASPFLAHPGTGPVERPSEPSLAARPMSGRSAAVGSAIPQHKNRPEQRPLPNTSQPAPAHATVRTIGLRQHRWEIRSGRLASLALVVWSLSLTACNDLERTAYRTLAVTRAEYETLQQQVVEAALHDLITEEQWDRFTVAGHRFIHAHNAAVDAFALWSQTKTKDHAAKLEAMLEILPRLIREINELMGSFERESGASSEKSGVKQGNQSRDSNGAATRLGGRIANLVAACSRFDKLRAGSARLGFTNPRHKKHAVATTTLWR